jgi:hypothetical protein
VRRFAEIPEIAAGQAAFSRRRAESGLSLTAISRVLAQSSGQEHGPHDAAGGE